METERYVLIVGGGTGRRMGAPVPKQYITLLGKKILLHTVERFLKVENIVRWVTVVPEGYEAMTRDLIAQNVGFDFLRLHRTTPGGPTRTASVWRGLTALNENFDAPAKENALVAIHDAARPLIDPVVIENGFKNAETKGSAVACLKVRHSLRQITENGTRAVRREMFLEVQTPQIFPFGQLYQAYKRFKDSDFSDDAALYEAAGFAVHTYPGSEVNLKITYPTDLAVAEQILLNKKYF
ncbi:MAG: 2-C-methyl-D-erythritol 4-phosphate cytidylyltransferase [Bacteroidia bacterium]|nr:2-C-methyl-D-erythritol 4-phosphate cytidylyltransferase [Bacteroidia bacterium]MDW8334280.1 2-C-methyl-D-erythritol 4-phosphate cytidylyltransferase [Bacteroidia bacterium]